MKKTIAVALLLLTSFLSFSQIHEPVKWFTSVEKISESEFDLVAKATIESGWHLYSQAIPDGGPIPTTFSFKDVENVYQLIGKTVEGKGHEEFDKVFEMDIKYFEKEALFKQRVKLLKADKFDINGVVEFMVCDDTNCLPPTEVEISFAVEGKASDKRESATVIDEQKKDNNPKSEDIKEKKEEEKVGLVENGEDKPKSLWVILLTTFIAGLLVLFTPCVFPMIPMTVSFFLKQEEKKSKGKFNAIFYGLSIIIIYVLISIPFHLFESLSPSIFNSISTNVPLNISFFIIFVVFAISFFGAFEIMIPNRIASKADDASNSGGLIGIFFMALTLIIVSFSCTGPALGFIIGGVLTTDGGANALTVAMFGFGLGLSLPFMMFALFPSLLKNLPKSGGWLNTVKVVFGFIELALAFKFLSNADLVLDAHLLEREVFIAIWIAIFGAMVLYLFGKIQLPHDSPLSHISVSRLIFGLLVLSFTVYLIPGLWGAPLKIISGFPPPMKYSESPYGVGFTKLGSGGSVKDTLPDGAEFGPHDIVSFLDYEKGMKYAKSVNKPVLLDFTGKACVNCRKMEERVWSENKILRVLKNDVVLISLYVDYRKELPKSEQFISKLTGRKIKTVGQKWSDFQTTKFEANAQPFYVLIDANGENLLSPVGYTPDVDEYYNWLKEGIGNFKLKE